MISSINGIANAKRKPKMIADMNECSVMKSNIYCISRTSDTSID